MVDSNADLIADYLGEAKDYLEKLNEKLMLLEDGVPPPELVNDLFRSAHSLKGLSACFGFDRTKLLTHRLENLLSAIKRGDLIPEPVLVRTMFDAVDVLEALTSEIAGTGAEATSIEDYLLRLDAACPGPVGGQGAASAESPKSAAPRNAAETPKPHPEVSGSMPMASPTPAAASNPSPRPAEAPAIAKSDAAAVEIGRAHV